MKNLIRLHEAIALALLNKKNRTATFDEVVAFIEKRRLYPKRKGNIPLSVQVMLRATKSNKRYSHLFEEVADNAIKLRSL